MTAASERADAAAFARAHDAVLADRRIQFGLPPAPRSRPPAWLEAAMHWLQAHWHAIRIGIWILLALAAAALIVAIVLRLQGIRLPWPRGASDDPGDAPEWRPDAAPARALLAEADALAAAGRFAEAARLVLARSFEDVQRHRPGAVRAATTARDVVADPRVPTMARPAFAAIADVVEIALFADRGATAAAWARARDAYAEFALPGHWR